MDPTAKRAQELQEHLRDSTWHINAKEPKLKHARHSGGGMTWIFGYARTTVAPKPEQILELLRQDLHDAKPVWLTEWEKHRRKRGLQSWF